MENRTLPTTEEAAFLENLRKSRLLTPELVAQVAGKPSTLSLPQRFLKSGLLTPFQVEQIQEGSARRLRVGEFQILDVIGWGGMGTVYKAQHPRSKEPVALKILAQRFRHDPGMRARFCLETRVGERCQHPHLLQMIESGVTDDLFGEADYQVMELFEGIALHELVNLRGRLSVGLACDLIRQAAEGLHALHEAGMVHRDVKPDNILVGRTGHVKVLDFGLALADKAVSDEFSLSMIFGHDCLGTPDYIAPEQTLDSLHVDRRADIYSLGCTLFAILAARPPFQGPDRSQVLKAHRELPPRSVRKWVPSVPKELDALLQRMMAKRPEDRPATLQEVIRALDVLGDPTGVDFDFSVVLKARRKIAERKGWERGATSLTSRSSVMAPTRSTQLSMGSTVSERPARKMRYAALEDVPATPNAVQMVEALQKKSPVRAPGRGKAKASAAWWLVPVLLGIVAAIAAVIAFAS